jgi:hypothetical protein
VAFINLIKSMEIQQKCSICNNDLISLVTGKKVCRNCGVISSPEPVSSFEQAIDKLEQSLPQAPNSGERDLILMKGTVESYSLRQDLGIIKGEDNELYQFIWKDWNAKGVRYPDKDTPVTFEKRDSAWACNIKPQETDKQKAVNAQNGGCGCFVILLFFGFLLFSGKDQSSTSPSNQDLTECSGKATQEYQATRGDSMKSNEDIAYGRVLIGKHCGF